MLRIAMPGNCMGGFRKKGGGLGHDDMEKEHTIREGDALQPSNGGETGGGLRTEG